MDNERLQDIKAKHLLHGAEEWTNQEDADTEAVIKELIAAVEELQAEVERLRVHPTPMGREPANNWRGGK